MSRKEAEQIQDLLGKPVAEEPQKQEYVHVQRLRKKHLLIAASTAGSFGIALSIIGTITSQINQFITDTQIYNYVESLELPGTNLVILMILAMILLAWLLSLFGTLIQYSGFTLICRQDELVINRGLFERKQITIPYQRIQAVRVVEGILRQPFGYATVYVDTAGYGDESGGSTILFPLIKLDEVEDFIQTNLPDYKVEVPSVSPPSRALRRYLVRAVVPTLLVTLPITWYFQYGYFALALLPLAAWLGTMRYRDAGVGFAGESLIMRFRNLARSTVVLKKNSIQASNNQHTYFQRRKQLSTVMVTVASGGAGAVFAVKDMDQDAGGYVFAFTSSIPAGNGLPNFSHKLPVWTIP